jgi:hypothetical protein
MIFIWASKAIHPVLPSCSCWFPSLVDFHIFPVIVVIVVLVLLVVIIVVQGGAPPVINGL